MTAHQRGFQILRFVKDFEETVPRPTLREIRLGLGARTRQAVFGTLAWMLRDQLLVRVEGHYGLTAKGAETLALYEAGQTLAAEVQGGGD